MFTRAVVIVIMALACATSVLANSPKLTPQNREVFCGKDGHETSAAYAEAVNTEVSWRMAAGARTPKEAIGQMQREYCAAAGGTK